MLNCVTFNVPFLPHLLSPFILLKLYILLPLALISLTQHSNTKPQTELRLNNLKNMKPQIPLIISHGATCS